MTNPTITIRQNADGLPPLATSLYPNGDRPYYSHTENNIRIVATYGVPNNCVASVELLAGSGLTYSTPPTNRIYMGFGQGVLYTSSAGASIGNHTDVVTGKNWTFETPRTLVDDSGYRYLSTGGGGSGITFDNGATIPLGSIVYQSSVTKASADAVNVGGDTQWKTYRIYDATENANNSIYFKTFGDSQTGTGKGEVDIYGGTGTSYVYYNGDHPTLDNKWTFSGWTLKYSSLDTIDGLVLGRTIRNDGTGLFNGGYTNATYPTMGSDTAVAIKLADSSSANRWQKFFCQDFINFSTNPVVCRTDFTILIGSAARFMIANSSHPSTTTEAYDIITDYVSSTKCLVRLWKGRFASLSGKYLHYYNNNDVFVFSISLGV